MSPSGRPLRPRAPWLALGLGALLLALALGLDQLEPLLRLLFPEQDRVIYRQASALQLLLEHLRLVAAASLASLALALGLGIAVTRPAGRMLRPLVDTLIAMGQTVPPVAVLALAVPVLGFGLLPAWIALVAYGLLPMLKGVTAGLDSVPAEAKDAARGLGMSPRQVLRQVELPLARPVLLAGVRSSVSITIGTAAIAATVGAPNLGAPILVGLSGFNTAYVLQGAVLTGLLALSIDAALAWCQAGD